MPIAECPSREEIASLSTPELLRRFSRGVECFDRRIVDLSESQLDQAFLPEAGVGCWPPRVLVGHLADAELQNLARMRKAAGEQDPVFTPWDENAFIDSGLYGSGTRATPVGAFIALIHTLRRVAASWLATLDEAGWARRGLHQQLGPLSIRDLADMNTWHLEHHARFLNAKIERLLGPAAEVAPVSGACGPSCGCHGRDGPA